MTIKRLDTPQDLALLARLECDVCGASLEVTRMAAVAGTAEDRMALFALDHAHPHGKVEPADEVPLHGAGGHFPAAVAQRQGPSAGVITGDHLAPVQRVHTAYDLAHQGGNSSYRFGLDRALTASFLRGLAADIETGRVLLHGATVTTTASHDEWVDTAATIRYVEQREPPKKE